MISKEQKQFQIAEGKTCLTCKNTPTAVGEKLLCQKFNKLVSLHSTCESYGIKGRKR